MPESAHTKPRQLSKNRAAFLVSRAAHSSHSPTAAALRPTLLRTATERLLTPRLMYMLSDAQNRHQGEASIKLTGSFLHTEPHACRQSDFGVS